VVFAKINIGKTKQNETNKKNILIKFRNTNTNVVLIFEFNSFFVIITTAAHSSKYGGSGRFVKHSKHSIHENTLTSHQKQLVLRWLNYYAFVITPNF
jgi:hypothetical protein